MGTSVRRKSSHQKRHRCGQCALWRYVSPWALSVDTLPSQPAMRTKATKRRDGARIYILAWGVTAPRYPNVCARIPGHRLSNPCLQNSYRLSLLNFNAILGQPASERSASPVRPSTPSRSLLCGRPGPHAQRTNLGSCPSQTTSSWCPCLRGLPCGRG